MSTDKETTPQTRSPLLVRCVEAPLHFIFNFLKLNNHTGQESFQLVNKIVRRGYQLMITFHSEICSELDGNKFIQNLHFLSQKGPQR